MTLIFCLLVSAQAFSKQSEPLKIVVPFAAGGTTDITARILAESITKETNQVVVVENRPGGFAAVALDYVSRQPNDGRTLIIAANGVTTQRHYLPDARDLLKELSVVTMISEAPMVLMTSPNSRFISLESIITFSKLNPERVNYATVGQSGALQMAADLFQRKANIRLNPIPYQGGSAATVDLLGNRIDLVFDSVATGRSTVNSGARPIAVTSPYRSRLFPDTPTFKELGLDIEFTPWQALFVMNNVNRETREDLNRMIRNVLSNPETIKRFIDMGMDRVLGTSLEDSERLLNQEVYRWEQVLR